MTKLDKYTYEYRQQIKTGDLIEFASDSITGKLIRWRTGHDVNHTAIVVNMRDYFQTRIMILEALQLVTLNFLSNRLQDNMVHVYWLPLKKEHEHFRRLTGQKSLDFVGRKYDYKGIFKSIFGHVSVDMHKAFCSELAYVATRNAGLPLADHDRNIAPWPGEFEKLGIYEKRVRIF